MSREHYITTRGAWDTRHWIHIPAIAHEADGIQITHHLKALTGVREVNVTINTKGVQVTYNQTLIDFEHILEKLTEIGFPASDSWWSRKKADWFQYLDTNASINANASLPPCCSNPRGLNTGKKNTPTKRH